jgi:lipoprotein-releasing system permease protein
MVTLIVADGMIRGITDRYLELGTGHLQVYDFFEAGEFRDRLPGTLDIRGVWPERQGLGVLVGKGGKAGATIRAVESSFWDDPGSGRYLLTIAGVSRPGSGGEVLLGEELARTLGADIGDTLRIMTTRFSEDNRIVPRLSPFTVAGIVSSGYRELDSLWCVMSYEAGERILPPELSTSRYLIKIGDPYGEADAAAEELARLLGPGYGVYTWKELQRSQYSSYESTRQLLLFIMALIVLVAAVNVSSATSMLAIERQRDIAVLKAAGAGPAGTSRVFLWGAFLTGITGAAAGIGLGLVIGGFINPLIAGLEKFINLFSLLLRREPVKILDPSYYLQTIPIVIDWKTVFLIGLFTVLSSVLSSWIPASRAGRLKPMEILRKY